MLSLALAVWHGRRDPVHIHSNTAHPEGGAGTKPTHRQLRITGVVLAVLNLQARGRYQAIPRG